MLKSSFLVTLFLAVSLPSSSAVYPIDLYPPYHGLMARLENISDIDIPKLLAAATELLGCFPPLPENPSLFAESEFLDIRDMKVNLFSNFTDSLKEYVKTPEFAEIHNYLWADAHWVDMIRFFYNSGFNSDTDPTRNIYNKIRQLYSFLEVPPHLIVPSGPPTSPPKNPITKTVSMLPSSLPWTLMSLFQEEEGCTEEKLMQLIQDIIDSQGLQWMELIRFGIGEINSNPSVHASWAKITEPAKGLAFRNFRQIDAMLKLIHHWDTQLKNNEQFRLVISIVEGFTGINFDALNIDVIGSTISILEWLIWGSPFPRPDFV